MLLYRGRGSASAGAEVDEDIVADSGAEVAGDDAGDKLCRGAFLEDRNLYGCKPVVV